MKNLPIIKKENIKLIQPDLTDRIIQTYGGWLKQPSVKKGIGGQEDYIPKEIYELLNRWKKNPLKIHYLIYLVEQGREIPAGDINLDIISRRNQEDYSEFYNVPDFFNSNAAEVAIMLSEDFRKKGLGKSSLNLLVEYAFNKKNLDLLLASIYEDNPDSLKLFKKCGFEERYSMTEEESGEEEFILSLRK